MRRKLLIMSMLTLLTSCARDIKSSEYSSSVNTTIETTQQQETESQEETEKSLTETETETESETETETEKPTETETNSGTNKLTGYTELSETAGVFDDIIHIAKLDDKLENEDGYIRIKEILSLGENRIYAEYIVCNNYIPYGGEIDAPDDSEYVIHGAIYDIETKKLLEDKIIIEYEAKESQYISSYSYLDGANIVTEIFFGNGNKNIIVNDKELNQINSFEWNEGITVKIDTTGKAYYSTQDGRIYKCDAKGKQELNLSPTVLIKSIDAVFKEDGVELISGQCYAGDLSAYNFIAETETGNIVDMKPATENERYKIKTGDVICEQSFVFDEDNGTSTDNYEILGTSFLSCNLVWNNVDSSFVINPSDNILVSGGMYQSENGSRLELNIFDNDCTPCASTLLNLAWGESLLGEPVVLENGQIILITINYGEINFYSWNPVKNDISESCMEIQKINPQERHVESSYGDYNPITFGPQELSDSLSDCRLRADEIEKKYGVEILIGEECGLFDGVYYVCALTDPSTVMGLLNSLDEEFARYPEGFVNKACEFANEIDIYIAGEIIGVSDENLSRAGGFQCISPTGAITIVVDGTDSLAMTSNIHHEFSHALDGLLSSNYDSDGNPYLSEDIWNSLNPESFSYLGTYQDYYLNPNATEYMYGATENSNVYFLDDYSQTFMTEDKARLFEEYMSGNYCLEWDEYPHLKSKCNYFIDCVNRMFSDIEPLANK